MFGDEFATADIALFSYSTQFGHCRPRAALGIQTAPYQRSCV
jgi:hypothetical protein